MNEVSPCKKCENVNEDKNKNPACIRCIDEGMPGRYAKGVEDRHINDPEVFKMHSPDEYIKRICHHNGISVEILMDPKTKKKGAVSKIRKKIALGLREKFEIKDSQIARVLNITQSSVWRMFKYDEYKDTVKKRAEAKKIKKSDVAKINHINAIEIKIIPCGWSLDKERVQLRIGLNVDGIVHSYQEEFYVNQFKSRFDHIMEYAKEKIKHLVFDAEKKGDSQ